jgi:hypothetical protein
MQLTDAVEPAGTENRYHALDALRAFALLLGVVFHAAESFGAHNYYWAVVDSSPSEFLEWFRHGCHSFRLEVFFLIAGFFARLLLHRRGTRGFVHNRILRILVPLVVGWAVLYPLLVFLWILGKASMGQLGSMGVPPDAQQLAPAVLTLFFFLSLQFVKMFDLTHLWFLHQLLVIYVLVLGWRSAWFGWVDRRGDRLRWWDGIFERVVRSRWCSGWFVLPTVPLLMLMQGWSVDTPKTSLWPEVPTTLLFGFCFMTGWMLHRQPELLKVPESRWWQHLQIGILLMAITGYVSGQLPSRGYAGAGSLAIRASYGLLYGLMMWSLVWGFIGLFRRFCSRPSAGWRYVADSSYWIYLVHLPLVVYLQIVVAPWGVPWPIKYGLILLIALPVLFLSYHYLVRSTFIGVQLNGRRYPRRWPWQAEAAGVRQDAIA